MCVLRDCVGDDRANGASEIVFFDVACDVAVLGLDVGGRKGVFDDRPFGGREKLDGGAQFGFGFFDATGGKGAFPVRG